MKCNPPNYCCDRSYFGCRGRCIPENWIKDGKQDCENGSDERGAYNFVKIIDYYWFPMMSYNLISFIKRTIPSAVISRSYCF